MRTIAELAQLVKEMRDAQKAYFKHRQGVDLITSKALESIVDGAVAAILADATGLFKDEADDRG